LHELNDNNSILQLGVRSSADAWINFVKNYYTKKQDNKLILDKEVRFPLLVNVFRRKLYKKTYTLADDFERCIDLVNSGYLVFIPEDESLPRMISEQEKFTFKGLLKQKERTALARKQLVEKYHKEYKLDSRFHLFLLGYWFRIPFRAKFGLIAYIFIFTFGSIIQLFSSKKTTKEGWTMRIER
jgi:hypothetical protein